MGVARNTLLWISENRKLRQALPKYRFIRRAVSRFMPGELLEDALRAAERLKPLSISSVFTLLGENVADEREAKQEVTHYVAMLRQISTRGLDTHVSVKLTHLGLDLNEDLCVNNLLAIVAEAKALNNMVWIDMEQSQYVDRTIDVYKKVRKDYPNVGLCLQAYLYRTEKDLEDLFPQKPTIRFVKGAYKEPPSVAFKKKSDVDENFFKLSKALLGQVGNGAKLVAGTHDMQLIRRIQVEAERVGAQRSDYEFHLLYGIQANEQQRLAREGYSVRVLISYGSFWFPWYIRRLAERPANVWFVVRKMFSS
ncbi:MAG: proline dehydrogenase family protein [Ignavibacteriales bacterium]|nr:proline dehydrogenase family protein [Ignavibacteriales bacterium]